MTDRHPDPAPDGPALEFVPLGGLGEFGLNMMAVTCGETTIVIDAGAMFPGAELPGVDLVVPDMSYLRERKPKALVLTHGHEDHIGAVPYVLPHIDGPVYATPFTHALLARKLEEREFDLGDRAVAVKPRDRVRIGEIEVEFIRVTHSMPDCMALALHTPLGVIVHTGDFKIDQTPLDGEHFDFHRLAALGAEGVLALFGDSTNVDRRGYSGSELDVVEAFEEVFASAPGRLLVTTFASSIYRMQILVRLAAQFGRKVAFVGRSMVANSQAAQRLGFLEVPAGVLVRDTDVPALRPREVLCLTTGSQGEPTSALSRIAIDDHRFVKLEDDDTVVFSARAIPGNEKGIGRVINHITRRGADVITADMKPVHVSGHGSEEELKLVLSLVRPKYFVPVHGEYRQLAHHRRVAERVTGNIGRTVQVLLAQDGDVIRFDRNGAGLTGRVTAGRVLIDGTRVGEVGGEVLRDRRHLAEDGLALPVVAIRKQDGTLEGTPEIITRGFVHDPSDESLLTDGARLLAEVIESSSIEERTDPGLLREKVRQELRRFFRKRSGRRPLVLPVIMEI
jgi:ribonuclease J